MREWLRRQLGNRTGEQRAYDNGWLGGAVTVAGLLLIHRAAERAREGRA
jgi:hypothetical protein